MTLSNKKTILGASVGNCVHVAGILSFLKLAEKHGYETQFLGPATSIEKLADSINSINPEIAAVSYRLTPEVLKNLLVALKSEINKNNWQDKTFVFGGTPPTADVARKSGIFKAVFSGLESLDNIISFLKGKLEENKEFKLPPQTLVERIAYKRPYPLLRHHFGQPTVKQTIQGAREIALSETIDILSIGPDQNAQESFFRPHEMKPEQDGAGGVPLRCYKDLEAIYEASRCGNYPLLRCYSGTRDLINWAEMSLKTIHIAWGAIPLLWYNQVDGRSDRPLVDSIRENQEAMRWYAEHKIPLEVNESHHWSLRDAPDTVAVAAAFLAAYNAKQVGTTHYVAQYMFNTPSMTSPPMDLAKMLAKIEMIESLHDERFTSIRQTRTGLASLSPDPHIAKGQLATSCFYQMALDPQIIHVVGFCEGDHAATPSDIIESSKIVIGSINNYFLGLLPMLNDQKIQDRKEELIEDARYLLQAIKKIASNDVIDPWTDPYTLARSVEKGLLDSPHLAGRPHAAGKILTKMVDGACLTVDPDTYKPLNEKERISRILKAL